MSPRRRRAAAMVSLAASLLMLAGCVASAPPAAERPTDDTRPSASPAPVASTDSGSPAPLVIPSADPDELARVVYTSEGADGVPTSASQISAAPIPDQPYALEGTCTPKGAVVMVSYRIVSTDDKAAELQAGSFPCDGTGIRNVGVLDTDSPPQVMFTLTDGASEAYLRLIPYDE